MPLGTITYGKNPPYKNRYPYMKPSGGHYQIKSSTKEVTEYDETTFDEAVDHVNFRLGISEYKWNKPKNVRNATVKIYGRMPYTGKELLCAIYKNHKWKKYQKNINTIERAW